MKNSFFVARPATVTSRGGGGSREVLPPTKRWGRKSFSHVEGGAQKVSTFNFKPWELEVLAILRGDTKGFHPLKGGRRNVLPCLEGYI